jgi:glycosyltransferase involved in cell wall biosynthesis
MSDRKKDDKSNGKKSDNHKTKNLDNKPKIGNLCEFKKFVNINKASGKEWYRGLDGKWWWGMSEDDAIRCIEKGLISDIEADKVTLISTWNTNCGIATYTKYLFDDLAKIAPGSFTVNPIINKGILGYRIRDGLSHLQHEFGVAPKFPSMKGKLIITWHTVSKDMDETIKKFEHSYNVVAHIVHSECSRSEIYTSKDLWTVPHGSMMIPEIGKEEARKLLGINAKMPIGFVFGFQSRDKNYQRLIDAAENTGIHIIVSGAPHGLMGSTFLEESKNVTFINKFLTENDVNLYALASDMLLFDYVARDHHSASGAMHRIIGAGRPIICSDVKHFNDVSHDINCLKFKNQQRLERCIKQALKDSDRLGLAAREYAEKTSWEKIAKCHVDIYKRYSDIGQLRSIK